MACRTSAKAMFLNATFAPTRSYSLVNASTILEFAAPPTTPTVCPFRLSMLSIDDPGGVMINDNMADDDDRLRLRQVTDVAANHSEIDFACGERVSGLKRRPAVDDLEPHRRIRRNELACERRH